jgi:hypothetical protein
MAGAIGALMLSTGVLTAGGNGGVKDAGYCMDVEIDPFHMVPDGSCAVRDYWGGTLQEAFYSFTLDDHLFNCEYFGPTAPLPIGEVPSSVVSEGMITGTIGGHPFSGQLLCASLTNWYQDSCADPDDPQTCTFQLAQPFLKQGMPFPRVTEVSLIDGVVTVRRGKKELQVPLLLATRAAGITHVEDLNAPLVGASITHSLLGMLTYEDDDDGGVSELGGSADMLLQGHIFFPGSVEDDVDPDTGANEAAVIKGTICSEDLYKRLNKRGKRGRHGHRD